MDEIVVLSGTLEGISRTYTFTRDSFICRRTGSDIIEYTVDMRYTYYSPVFCSISGLFGKRTCFWLNYSLASCPQNCSHCIEFDVNSQDHNQELYSSLLQLNSTKKEFLNSCQNELISTTSSLFTEQNFYVILNFLNILSKTVTLDIEGYFAFKNLIFIYNNTTPDSFLKAYYNSYTFLDVSECKCLSVTGWRVNCDISFCTRPIINHYFDGISFPQQHYQKLFDFLELYNNRYKFNDRSKNPDKDLLTKYKTIKKFIEDIFSSTDVFTDLVTIMQKRYQFQQIDPRDATWVIFNRYLMKIYHDKWLDYCVCGEIGDRSLEEYIQQCYDEDMLSIENKEAITIFIFYYCYLLNDPIEYPNIQIADKIICLIEKCAKGNNLEAMENMLFSTSKVPTNQLIYTIDDIDLMNGTEFEELIAKLFKKMGYDVEVTKASGDQGIDVLATKNGFKYGIQAKCYSSQVGNSAIQEAVAGKAFYSLSKVIVVTNNFFTKSAIKLAEANNVILWDRNILTNKLMYLNQ